MLRTKVKENIKITNSDQNISVFGSFFFHLIELVGLLLHILAFALGLITLVGITLEGTGHLEEIFEICTLIVVALIITLHFIKPYIKKVIAKSMLIDFWGVNYIDKKLLSPTKIDLKSSGFGTIVSAKEVTSIEEVYIGWVRKSKFKKKKLAIAMTIPAVKRKWKKYADEDGNLVAFYVPKTLSINAKNQTMKMNSNISFADFVDDIKRETLFEFDGIKETIRWSGVFPDFPFYGEWKWKKGENKIPLRYKIFKAIFFKRSNNKKAKDKSGS